MQRLGYCYYRNTFKEITEANMQGQALKKDDLPDSIAQQIRTQILSGCLAPGDAVPPERELALRFGVNRTTVREAMRELEYSGLVARFQGKGCVVLDFREHGSLELLRYLVRLKDYPQLALEAANSMIDAFGAFYTSAVELVICRASREELSDLLSLAEAMATAIKRGASAEVYAADYHYHRTLARATHSIAYEFKVNNFFESDLYQATPFRLPVVDMYIQTQISPDKLPQYCLANALLAKDSETALDVVKRVVATMRKVIVGSL